MIKAARNWFLKGRKQLEFSTETIDLDVLTNSQETLTTVLKDIKSISNNIVNKLSRRECGTNGTPADKYECLGILYETINDSEDIICLTDYHSRIIYTNKRYLSTYGFTSPQEVIGRYANIVKSGESPSEVFTSMWLAIRSGKPWDGIITNKSTYGDLIKVHSSIVPITSHVGSIDYYICVQRIIREV